MWCSRAVIQCTVRVIWRIVSFVSLNFLVLIIPFESCCLCANGAPLRCSLVRAFLLRVVTLCFRKLVFMAPMLQKPWYIRVPE
ncbi:hypothetical protein HRI_000706100 [Hibiscus trionum]|uniref:Uncharacterized protein n=1 Tax=Hibiscus trionum TaxID=183268 RepID=A0A9W7LMR8_HIBTR|nr:hypothetical protein HRI_000706100 [Hibiscus trionum]